MLGWKTFWLACCLILGAGSAIAAVGDSHYCGQTVAVIGSQSQVIVNPDHVLSLSGIGASGSDGFSFSCAGAQGVSMPMLSSLKYVASVPARASMSYSWSIASRPPGSRAQLSSTSLLYSAGGLDITCSLTSSSSPEHVRLYRSGAVVLDVVHSPSAPMHVTCTTSSCGSSKPTLSFDLSHRAERCIVEFPSLVHLSVEAHDEDCDAMVVVHDLDGDGSLDLVTCTALDPTASPGGIGGGTLQCSSITVHSNDSWVATSDNASVKMTASAQPTFIPDVSGSYDVLSSRPPLASSGQDARSLMHFAPPSLVLPAGASDGSSLVTRLYGSSSIVSGGLLGSFTLTVSGSSFALSSDFSGIQAMSESVSVRRGGGEVARLALVHGVPGTSTAVVTSPPGGSTDMAIGTKGAPATKPKPSTSRGPNTAGVDAMGRSQAEASCTGDLLDFEIGFASNRVFVIGGQQFVGDELDWWGEQSSSAAGSLGGACVSVTRQVETVTCNGFTATPLTLFSSASSSGDFVAAEPAPSAHLSTTSTCVTVPVKIHRHAGTPVRGFSVNFHLGAELQPCSSAGQVAVTEGDYLSSFTNTQMEVLDNGGGSFTVDCAQLGPVCGSTGDGTLFTLALSAVQPAASGAGAIVIDAVQLRDCSNHAVVCDPGATAYIPIEFASPPALQGLTLSKSSSGNDSSGRMKNFYDWIRSSVALGSAVHVYVKGFGNYPLYQRGPSPGAVPAPPANEAAAADIGYLDINVHVNVSDDTFRFPTRDYLYACAFVVDRFGNASPASALSNGCPDYQYGDVSNGSAVCSGDNQVGLPDVSALGAHYGSSVPLSSTYACLDVGPTIDGSVTGLPTPDGRLQFEDLIIFSPLYGVPTTPMAQSRPAIRAAANSVKIDAPSLPRVGETFDLAIRGDGAGDAQAVSVHLDYDHAVLEQVAVAPGQLLGQQSRQAVALSSEPGDVDVALLGSGEGISGSGELARVTFRVKSAGDPRLAIASIEARDVSNRTVPVTPLVSAPVTVSRSGLTFAFPDPFRSATEVHFALRQAGQVTIAVHDIAGRRVRTLARGTQAAGLHTLTWDGRSDDGLRLAPGAYVVRFESAGLADSRLVRLIR